MAPVAPRGVSWRIRLPRWVKPVIFTVCLIPFVYLVWAAFNDGLGANPAEALIRSTGDLVIRGLCLVLLMTPLRTYFQWSSALSLRRMLGLFTFFYACLHFTTFIWFDHFFDLPGFQQFAEPKTVDPRVVGNHRQIFYPAVLERFNQRQRLPGVALAAQFIELSVVSRLIGVNVLVKKRVHAREQVLGFGGVFCKHGGSLYWGVAQNERPQRTHRL